MTKLARVFPRKTEGSPDDDLAFFGPPPGNVAELGIDEVHVSVAFTYDMKDAEKLAGEWGKVAPVEIGGPAFNKPSGDFVPGRYLKTGYTITSRGCPNKCWFCSVWKREPKLKELQITPGWILQDDNILSCSLEHISGVFGMLSAQSNPVQLMGMEAAKLTDVLTDMLWWLRPRQMFFAYDTPDDLEPLIYAGRLLRYADFTRSHLRCYVLIGYKGDTMELARKRLVEAWAAGFLPCAMLWKNKNGDTLPEWRKFQRSWTRPAATKTLMKCTTMSHLASGGAL